MSDADVYDYVVVGGGSSGCVTANRLVTEHGARVLLLEGGHENDNIVLRWPALAYKMIRGTSRFMKQLVTNAAPTLDGRRLVVNQGNVLGGGSSVNVMVYCRGSKEDYERWSQATGADWGWKQMLRVFRRQEDNQRLNNAEHGQGGPLKVSDPISSPPSTSIFIETVQRLGVPHNPDLTSGTLTGVGRIQTTMYRGQRWSAATAFLTPIRKDPRLTVLTGAPAQALIMEGNRAVGVNYLHDGQLKQARARNEVILTAGPLVTPKLLMLSGIGPREHLAGHGIACIADLPGVGANLHDHPIASISVETKGNFGFYGADKGLTAAINGIKYLLFRKGPIASNGADNMAFTNISGTGPEPDLQMYCIPVMLPEYQSGANAPGITLCANFVQPKARGTVRLRSADPADELEIDYNWLDDPEDAALALRGVKYLRKIIATEPLASIIKEERLQGGGTSDAALMAHVRRNLRTYYHPVGTCRMGSAEDEMAVLTPDLRVRGVEGLRVFDVSAIPTIVSSATNATAMAIAERGVELMMQGASAPASS